MVDSIFLSKLEDGQLLDDGRWTWGRSGCWSSDVSAIKRIGELHQGGSRLRHLGKTRRDYFLQSIDELDVNIGFATPFGIFLV